VTLEHQAMVSHLNAPMLLQMPATITSSRVRWEVYR
jgi:hypothetical protein